MKQFSFLLHILQLFIEFVVIAVFDVLYFNENKGHAKRISTMYNILICDDEKTERELIIFLLEKEFKNTFAITESANGKDALEIIRSHPIDILLSDIQMPLMSGIELARQAQKDFPDLKILFFSGYDDFEYVQNALVLHAVNYILKPINPDKFKKSMLEIITSLNSSNLQYTNSESFIENNFHDSKESHPGIRQTQPADDMLSKIDNALRFKQINDIESLIESVLLKYSDSKTRSHIYIRYVSSSILRMIISHLNDATDADFDELATQIFAFKHYSDIQALIKKYLHRLLDQYRQETNGSNYAVTTVKQYIESHYSEDLSLNFLADMVFLNPNYLSTVFTRETSCSINKYIKNVRMKHAVDLLINSNKKIVDIAKETGYSNTSYFIRAFQSIYGTSPEKYRNG